MLKKKVLRLILFVSLVFNQACGIESINKNKTKDKNSQLNREWDSINAPERMGLKANNYERNYKKLAKKSRLKKTPWSGGYWPSYLGGITYRWNSNSNKNKKKSLLRNKGNV